MSPMNQQTVTYDVQQLKVYALATSDVVGGASPTYSTGVILEGVNSVSLSPNMVTGELKGDGGMVLSVKGRTDRLMADFGYGRLGLDSMVTMIGGTTTDTGSAGTEVVSWGLSMPNALPFFKVECDIQNLDNGVADLHIILLKAMLKSATFIDSKTDAFGQPKISVQAIPLLSTGQIGYINLYATVTPLD